MTFACHQSWEVAHGSTPLQRNSESNDRHLSFANVSECRAQVSVPTSFITYPTIHEDESQGSSPRLRREAASLKCQKFPGRTGYRSDSDGRICCSFWNSGSFSTLSVVAEEKPWEDSFTPRGCAQQESDLLSTSSSIGNNSSEGDEWEDDTEDCEVQSRYQGPLDTVCSLEAALPSKKGLSEFYVGKSRSYSCLADITSVAEISKPENPYAKRRKHLFASIERRQQFRQIQNRSSKRLNKAQDRNISAPSRSFSLSDFHNARQNYI